MTDRIAEHNKEMWERLAKAAMNYTRPFGRPPRTRAGMRRFMDPRGRLKGVRLAGVWVPGRFLRGGCGLVIFVRWGGRATPLTNLPLLVVKCAYTPGPAA